MAPTHASSTPPNPAHPYSSDQVNYLGARGITPEMALARDVLNIQHESVLPEGTANYWTAENGYLPGLLFPWTSPDGDVVWQLHPDAELIVVDPKTGKIDTKKFVFPAGVKAPLWALKVVDDPRITLIVEGTCQSIMAAEYADPDVAVYGVAGCWNWSSNQLATADLKVVDSSDVVIMFDADVAHNTMVRDALVELMTECSNENAESVKWNTAGRGKNGLDDVLAGKPGRESVYLRNLIKNAQAKKPAKVSKSEENAQKRVKARVEAEKREQQIDEQTGRPRLDISGDKHELANEIVQTLRRWDGDNLFTRGNQLTRRQSDELSDVDREHLGDILGYLSRPGYENTMTGEWVDQWPDMQTQGVALVRSHRTFAPLLSVVKAPFIREDGTVCQANGYDADSKTYLRMAPGLAESIEIDDDPSPEDVQAAVKLLLDDWLVDFPFPAQSDRANALALMITPFIRTWTEIDLVPLAAINGNGPSAGKGLLLNLFSILITGEMADLTTYPSDDESEMRKQITSALMLGKPLLMWDEGHIVQGRSMAQFLTVYQWVDRLLGGNKLAYLPNRVTAAVAGNNQRVEADCSRRYYEIRIAPGMENPENRPASSFRHPNLKAWTKEHRGELVAAVLTLIRSWHMNDRPLGENWMGSFERWQEAIGGILANAHVPGFLDGLREQRVIANSSGEEWGVHLAWLQTAFGSKSFKCSQVGTKLAYMGADAPLPPGRQLAMPDTTANYAQLLGKLYASKKDQWSNGLGVERVGLREGYVHWRVILKEEEVVEHEYRDETDIEPENRSGGSGGSSRDLFTPHVREEKLVYVDDHEKEEKTHVRGEGGWIPPSPTTPTMGSEGPFDALYASKAEVYVHEECPVCGGVQERVPPAFLIYACRSCHPATFEREA